MLFNKRFGFIGGGALGQALIKGMLKAGLTTPGQISVCDISEKTLAHLTAAFKINPCQADTQAELEMIKKSDFLFLAVKPNIVFKVLDKAAPLINPSAILVSVAAGITISSLEEKLPGVAVVRAMPNTPAAVGAGMTAIVKGRHTDENALNAVSAVFASVGKTLRVEEYVMDAVTALSGSGPAYAFLLIEALSDAGVKAGIARQDALFLVAQTLLGAASMVIQTGEHPAKLKDMVTSPGGTTIAGLHVLEKNGVRAALIEAVEAAAHKSREMGKKQ